MHQKFLKAKLVILFATWILGCTSGIVAPERSPATAAATANACDRRPASCLGKLAGYRLEDYFSILKKVGQSEAAVGWESQRLTSAILSDKSRISQIIKMVLYEDPVLIQEMDAMIEKLGGQTNSHFWNTYFQSYDKTVGFNKGYVGIYETMSKYLPQSGAILDAGSGTGNGSLLLTILSAERHMTAVDISDYGLALAKKKVESIDPSFQIVHASLTDFTRENFADGAFMNNVLYTLPDKLAALKRVYNALKPGAVLVLSDPKPSMALPKLVLSRIASMYFNSSLENGADYSEFDLALVARMNFGTLIKAKNFMSAKELTSLAEAAGFKVEAKERVYYGGATLLVLRKP